MSLEADLLPKTHAGGGEADIIWKYEATCFYPIQTSELKTLFKFDVKYPQVYKMLDTAYNSEGAPKEWYENNIVQEVGVYNGHEI